MEFIKLSEKKVLLIFFTPEVEVLNKIFSLDKSYSQIQLQEASNYITNKFSGLTFEEVKRKVMQELSQHREDLGELLKKIVDEGNTVLGETEESVVISGQDHLFDLTELSENASKLRNLYKLLAQKTQRLALSCGPSMAKRPRWKRTSCQAPNVTGRGAKWPPAVIRHAAHSMGPVATAHTPLLQLC